MKLFFLWSGSMSTYGMYRQYNTTVSEKYNLFGHRLAFSIANGVLYTTPYGIIKMLSLMNRIDIKINKKEPNMYLDCYGEILGYNMSVI